MSETREIHVDRNPAHNNSAVHNVGRAHDNTAATEAVPRVRGIPGDNTEDNMLAESLEQTALSSSRRQRQSPTTSSVASIKSLILTIR